MLQPQAYASGRASNWHVVQQFGNDESHQVAVPAVARNELQDPVGRGLGIVLEARSERNKYEPVERSPEHSVIHFAVHSLTNERNGLALGIVIDGQRREPVYWDVEKPERSQLLGDCLTHFGPE